MKTGKKYLVITLAAILILLSVAFFYNQLPSNEQTRAEYLQNLIADIDSNITDSYITVNGMNTHYLESGKGKNVVLLHGAGEGGVTWYPVLGKLSKKYHIIIPDIVGYGESDKPDASYDQEYFSSWLRNFLDAKNISKATVIGSSQGGAITVHFTVNNPEYVDNLILVDPAGFHDIDSRILFNMLLLNIFPSDFLADIANNDLVYNKSRINSNWTYYGVEVLRTKGGKNVFWQGRGKITEKIPQEKMNEINQKTLIIWGENDTFFRLNELNSSIFGSSVKIITIKNAGHLPFIDQPEIFVKEVIGFLEE